MKIILVSLTPAVLLAMLPLTSTDHALFVSQVPTQMLMEGAASCVLCINLVLRMGLQAVRVARAIPGLKYWVLNLCEIVYA